MSAPPRRGLLVLALGLLCLYHLGLRAAGLRIPMTSDEGEYAYQARLLAEGGLPYRDAYGQKPPMVFLLYRLAYALPGAGGDRASPLPPRLLAAAFTCAAMLLLFLLAPPDWSAAARLCAPGALAAMSVQPVGDLFTANTEVFLGAFLCLSALSLSRAWRREEGGGDARPWLLACGLSCGASLLTKQTALWSVLAFAALAAAPPAGSLGRGRAASRAGAAAALGRLAPFAAGATLPPALFAAYFAARGGLGDLIEQALVRNMDYAALLSRPGAAAQQLSWLLRTLLPLLLRGDWPFYLLALCGLAASRAGGARRVETLAALWLAASWTGVLTGLFLFPHYFLQAAPPLALCAALGVELLHRRDARAGAAAALCACLWPALAGARAFFLEGPEAAARRQLFPNPLYEAAALGRLIREAAAPGDAAYVFGSEPQLYLHAGLRCATRHIYAYPLTLFPRGPRDVEEELSALRRRPPRFFVVVDVPASTLVATPEGERLREGLAELVRERYRLSAALPVLGGAGEPPPPAGRGAPARESLLLFELVHSGA